MLGLCCAAGFSLVVASRVYFLVAVHELLTVALLLWNEAGAGAPGSRGCSNRRAWAQQL